MIFANQLLIYYHKTRILIMINPISCIINTDAWILYTINA